mmetsp:Transcript_6441/g.12232  ORF Transcript_6441/g.12232 Transcript_6441/m.12232 type:complete len:400 (+) Transcript_6441:471-1670(+)
MTLPRRDDGTKAPEFRDGHSRALHLAVAQQNRALLRRKETFHQYKLGQGGAQLNIGFVVIALPIRSHGAILLQLRRQIIPVVIVSAPLPLRFQHVLTPSVFEKHFLYRRHVLVVRVGTEAVQTGEGRANPSRLVALRRRKETFHHARSRQLLLYLLGARQMVSHAGALGRNPPLQSLAGQPLDAGAVRGRIVSRRIVGGGVSGSEVHHRYFLRDIAAAAVEREAAAVLVEDDLRVNFRERHAHHRDAMMFPQCEFQQALIDGVRFVRLNDEQYYGMGALVRSIDETLAVSIVRHGDARWNSYHGWTFWHSPFQLISVGTALLVTPRAAHSDITHHGTFVLPQKVGQLSLLPSGQESVQICHGRRESGEGGGDGVQLHLLQRIFPLFVAVCGLMEHVVAP